MSKMKALLTSLILILAVLSVSTFAQSTNATLSGTVTDSSGAIVPGASVTVINTATGIERSATTNEQGSFVVPLLPPSNYTVKVQRAGFAPVEARDVILNVNDVRSLNIQLQVGEVNEQVKVTTDPPLVDESAAQATTIDRKFVGNLPLNGRSFQSLILLSPGVVQTAAGTANPGQFSVNGQRTNSNYFTVDGVSANIQSNITNVNGISSVTLTGQTLSGSLPGLSALGTTSTLASVDEVEQFKIQTSGYSAESGRQPGGQVQIVTRSGGRQFHGSIYDYVRNEKFDANNFFNNANGLRRQVFRQNDFGGTFSGPLFLPRFGEGGPEWYNGKKRTFFFFSYEGLRLLIPNTFNTVVPSLRLRAIAAPSWQPVLNAFSLPTGPELVDATGAPTGAAPSTTSFSNPKSSDSYAIRLDHQLTNKITLFGRFNETLSKDDSRVLSVNTAFLNTVRTLTLGTTYVANPTFTNEFKFNYSTSRGRGNTSSDNFGGAIPIDPSLLVSGYNGPGVRNGAAFLNFAGLPSIRLGDSQDSIQKQFNIVDNASVIKGNHQLKFGLDYRRLMPTFGPIAYSQTALALSQNDVINGRATIQLTQSRRASEPRFNNYSFYGQDTWKVNQRLTLDLGLRYELNPAPHDATGLSPIILTGIVGTNVSNATLASQGGPFYKTYKKGFAPRLGGVYQLSNKPGRETIVRGGFGVFYDLGSSQSLNGFSAFPFQSSRTLVNQPFPLPPALAQPPAFPAVALPITSTVFYTDPNLKLPYTLQYSAGIERSLGKNQVISANYVGSAGKRLLQTLTLNSPPNNSGPRANPNFSSIVVVNNGPYSNYNSLQLQYQRRLSQGLQVLLNYTLAHSTDTASDELSGALEPGNSSFDVRHNFSAAVSYNIPGFGGSRSLRAITSNFSLDSTIYIQSGQPFDITAGNVALADGTQVPIRADLVPDVPVWINEPTAPGGRRLNPAAFALPPTIPNCRNCFTRQGTLGRNSIYGPSLYQVNLGLHREFPIFERLRLQLRAEAFNLFNHPQFSAFNTLIGISNFGLASTTLNNSLGGVNALYQLGGPRSLQFAAKFIF